MHTDIQLLPQQAGMASILATAVINSKYATPRVRWVRLWVTLKSKIGAGVQLRSTGYSACKRCSFFTHMCAGSEGEG